MYTYTFNRVADIPVGHTGFWLMVIFCVIIAFIVWVADREDLVKLLLLMSVPLGIAYWVSFYVGDQKPQVFANVPVTAELVGFQPEGSRELVKSGKSQSYVDHHIMYVVYRVKDTHVILRAETGVEYPKTVVLYRN
jgi:hypothetical protein